MNTPSKDKAVLNYAKGPPRAWFKHRSTWVISVGIATGLAAIWILKEPAFARLRMLEIQRQCENLHRGDGEVVCEEDPTVARELLRNGQYREIIDYQKRRVVLDTRAWLKFHETLDPGNSLDLSMSAPWVCTQLLRPDGTKRLVALYLAREGPIATHERRQFAAMVIKPATMFSTARILVPQKVLSPVLKTPLGPLRLRLVDAGKKSPSSIELKWEVGDQSGFWHFTLTNDDQIELKLLDQ